MKKSPTYILSWLGLIGIINSQLIPFFATEKLSLWTAFLLLASISPVKGFLYNRRYTFQWAGFLAIFFLSVGLSEYFVIGTVTSSAFILLCSSVILYFGAVFHAKKLGVIERTMK
ncbi:MAG: DUF2069 domain-containing protein [Gammaproteobacteria bacterium]|nr:DUF2069 domain-containing protein [Gammaproteobacteria bacterium]